MSPELAHALNALDPVVLGSRLKATRVAAGLTQPGLAAEDASVAYLSRIESGQRRPSPTLLEKLAARLGVTVDFLVLGEAWEDSRRVELLLDHAELALLGGEAERALEQAREALAAPALSTVSGGAVRARYVEAAALDAQGDRAATDAYTRLLDERPDTATALKATTALSRIWREQGQLGKAVATAQAALDGLPRAELATEEAIRLQVTLAAALYTSGRTEEAAALCDDAIAVAEAHSTPVARASAYWNASVIRGDRGELTEALALAGRALALLEETERVRDTGRLRHQLAWIMLRSDPPQVEAAVDHLTRARAELDWSEASAADRAMNDHLRAHASFLAGDLDGAREVATGLVARIQGELPLRTAYVMTLLGQVAWAEGDRDEARTWYRRAVAELTAAGADREAAQLWFDLGTLAEAAGLADEARDAFRRSAASTGITSRLPVVPTTTPRTPTPRPGA